ncbi:MAG: type ISP restriction/modification enzyme [Promethearchaeota archaeon]
MEKIYQPDKSIESGNISPSDLSRNFSGSSVFYTPPFLIDCILQSANFLLQQRFLLPLGICSDKVECIDPSAGMLGFAISHLNFAHSNLNHEEFENWIENSFGTQHYAFEIDGSVKPRAIQKIQEVYSSIRNPDNEVSPHEIFKHKIFPYYYIRNPLDNSNASQIVEKLPPRNSDKLLLIYGNPPYAVSSTSKSAWITSLIEDYKTHLNRPGKKKIVGLKGIQDDYVKFIRYSQWLLADRNQPGIFAFVVNNYFLDGDIFRGMRHSLLTSFDEIYIINLFGDPKKSKPVNIKTKLRNNKTNPIYMGEEKDENVFDVQTGICIFIALRKTGKERSSSSSSSSSSSTSFAKVNYCGCYGSKSRKQEFCNQGFSQFPFQSVPLRLDYEFIPLSAEMISLELEYNKFPYMAEIFKENIIGVQSLHDSLITHPDKARLKAILAKFYDGTYDSQIIKDKLGQGWVKTEGVVYHDARDWKIADGKKSSLEKAIGNIQQWQWRGMDRWWVCYDEHLVTKGSSSYSLMQYMYPFQQNVAIILARSSRKASGENSVFLTSIIAESHCVEGGSGIGDYIFPLRYNSIRPKNINWNHPLPAEENNISNQFLSSLPANYCKSPKDVFSYIYAMLWTPLYRGKYQPLIKRDFPHIPFPERARFFQDYADLGKILIGLHGFFSHNEVSPKTSFPQNFFPQINYGGIKFSQSFNLKPVVRIPMYKASEKRIYFDGKNPDTSYWIGQISPEIWNFEIGGYAQIKQFLSHRKYILQPPNSTISMKKYRISRALNSEELTYLLHMCSVIHQTLQLLPQLDKIFKKIAGKWLSIEIRSKRRN